MRQLEFCPAIVYSAPAMKILVAGSGRHLLPNDDAFPAGPAAAPPTKADEDALLKPIRDAAYELGGALATAKHEIWVGSDDPKDVDPSVVEGALKAGGATAIAIKVPRGLAVPYKDKKDVHKEWGEFPDWDVTTMEVIDKVDAVVLMGGRLGVVQAGTSAWMMRKIVVPIGSFGGGAEKVGRYGSSRRKQFYKMALTDEEIDRLNSPWGAGLNADFLVSALGKIKEQVVVEQMDLRLLRWSTLLALGALLFWVLGLVLPSVAPSVPKLTEWKPAWSFALMFPTVIAAGIFGACVKTVRAMRLGTLASRASLSTDTLLGLAAGTVMAILYLLAQIGVSGTINLELEPKDYTRVAIVVSMASLFAGLYLDKAFAYFDNVGESVMKGTHGKKP
jgi:hypothetical protein